MDIRNKISVIYSLEQLSSGNSVIHSLHPMSKLLFTFVFIITVISFDRYDIYRFIPFILYLAIIIALSKTPFLMLLKRVLIVIPFCLFIGITNLVFEQNIAFTIGNLNITFGFLSFCVILFRAFLCVMAVLLLTAITPFTELTTQLLKLKMPKVFILMFEMTYRYIGVLFAEASSMHNAYLLRGAGKKAVEIRDAGSFIGSLLFRSFDRADRIYSAMKCRGYMLKNIIILENKFKMKDAVYCISIFLFCLLFRFIDIGRLI